MTPYFLLAQTTMSEGILTPQFLLMTGIFLVFYFFMIRPQQRRQQEQQHFLDKMQKGTEVVTVGGICGKVYEVSAKTVTLAADPKGTKITVLKGAISLDSTKQHTTEKK